MSSSGVNLESYLIPLDEIIRATENFSQQRCIGDGGFGAVYKGQLSERWQNRMAAIKRLGPDSYQGECEFRNEVEMISRFHHENIISFIGYCDECNEMIIVYEYAINGSLDYHLQDPDKMRCITWIQRLMICIGAARGLNYLHSGLGKHKRVIHRDVKSANILLDGNFVAKICDFGLSKVGPRNQPDTQLYTRVAGTPFYLDPTYQESRILRKESDVYSFGVVLFEILSGMLVYRERSIEGGEVQYLMNSVRRYHQKEPQKVIDPYIRGQIDSRSFDKFKEVAYQCISFNLLERPTLDTVIERIEEALAIQTYGDSASTTIELPMIESLIGKLNSISPSDQRTAAGEIRRLTKINANNRVIFAESEAIPLLTNLLTASDPRTQEHAVTALLNLSIFEENKNNIILAGAVPGIVHLLREGSMEARENAAATIFSLSVSNENRGTMGAAGAIPPLVLLLSEGTQRGRNDAANALFNLCKYTGNKGRAVRAGVVPVLMELLTEPKGVLMDQALAIVAILSTNNEGKLAIGESEAVPVLVEIIGSGSPNNKENATGVLVELCSADQKYLVEAQELGVLGKVSDLLHHGTDRGKRKAAKLLTYGDSASTTIELSMIESLIGKLNSISPSDQRTAAGEIRRLTKLNANNRVIFAESEAIPLLTNLLTASDPRTQEHAVTALLNLSIFEENKNNIILAGAVPGIVHLLREGSMEARENAAATIFSLSVIDENKVTIGAAGSIPPLVLLLSEGTQRGKKDAATALFNLCIYNGNKVRAVRAGVVPILMELLTEPNGVLMHEALSILSILSTNNEGKLAIGESEAVPVLVEIIGSGSPNNKENAAGVLAELCSGDQKYLVEAQELGVLEKLRDLLHHGTDRGKRKAAQLLVMITPE